MQTRSTISDEAQELSQCRSALCRIFSNPQRILILWLLADGERTVTEIALALGASLPGASQHLRLMELSNVIESRREGHNIYYRVADNGLLENCAILANRPKDKLMEVKLP